MRKDGEKLTHKIADARLGCAFKANETAVHTPDEYSLFGNRLHTASH
jgi:hypothetical protein